MDDRVGIGHGNLPVGALHARDHELPVDQIPHVFDRASVEQRVGELHRDLLGVFLFVRERGQGLVLLLELHVQGVADEDHRQDDAHHTQRVGHGVAQGDVRVADARGIGIGLLRGAQSGGVGHGAREDADHRGDRRPGHHMDDVGRQHAEQHDRRGAAHERHPAVLERREESRADLQADREDEEDQTEFLDEVPHLGIDRHAEVTGDDADEEDPGDAQRHALDLDLSEQDAERDDQGERQHGVRDAVT